MSRFSVNRLREIGKHCNLEDLDTEVKWQIIQKTSNRKVRQKALEKELSYDEIIRIGIADETTKRQAKETEKAVAGDSGNVNKVTSQAPGTSGPNRNRNNADIFYCNRCGRTHTARNCPTWGKTCHGCGKLNHLQSICNSSKQRQGRRQFQRRPRRQDKSRVNKVEQESDGSGSDGEYVKQVSVEYEINYIKGTVKQAQEKTMVKVMFSVDSGSSVNLIDEERFRLINKRSKTKLKLKKSKVKLFGYASKQPITVLGSFDAVLEVNEKYLPASFLVVKGKTDSSPLLGCDTAIDIGVLKIVNENDTCVNSEVQDITKEYDSIFHGIGKHKHAQVRLLENTSVKPVAQKNRRIPYHYREKLETEIKRLLDADVIEECLKMNQQHGCHQLL